MDTMRRNSAPSFRLVVKAGAAAGQVFELSQDVAIIGRSQQCDLVIAELELSRQHARFVRQGDDYLLEDLGSTNGTFLNGMRLTMPQRLQPGDEIRLGPKTVMVYEPVIFDAEATAVMEPAATARPAPVRSAPPVAPSPRPAEQAAPSTKEATPPQKRPWLLIGLLVVILLAACLLAGALWYIDANYLWCTVFPFLAGCP